MVAIFLETICLLNKTQASMICTNVTELNTLIDGMKVLEYLGTTPAPQETTTKTPPTCMISA